MRRRVSAVLASVLAVFLIAAGTSAATANDEPVPQIAGTILDENGDGYEGMTISVSAGSQYGSDVTDADGHYAISGLSTATFFVNVNRPGTVPLAEWPYRDLPFRQVTVVSAAETVANDYQMQLLPTGTAAISGVVRDHVTGGVIPGATVRLSYSSDAYYMSHIPSTTTDANGAYSFANLPPSDAMPPVILSFEKPGSYSTKTLSPTIGSGPTVRNTTLIPVVTGTGSIAGTVKLSNDAEFEWGSIQLMTAGWRMVGSSNPLNSGGTGEATYSFDGLPAGDYQLSVYVAGGAWRNLPVEVEDAELTPVDIVVSAYAVGDAVVSGSVEDTRTGDPVAGAQISLQPLYGQNTAHQSTYSEGDGTWQFEGVADGTYYLYSTAMGLPAPEGSLGWEGYQPPIEVQVVDGESIEGQLFEFRSFVGGDSVLDGRIRDSSTHLPVGAATVSLYRSASGTSLGEWETDSSGTFAADGLSDGDYYLTVTKDGYKTGNASVLVSDGHLSIVIPLTPIGDSSGLFSGGEISMRVFDSDGRLIDDARLNGWQPALDVDNWVYFDQWVDENGELTVSDLIAGHWVIMPVAQSPDGYRIFAPQHVDISASDPTAELEFHESVGSRITGQVDLNGFPASEVVIAAYDETGYWFSTGTVLDDGTYEIYDLPAGDIYLALQGGQMGYQGSSNASTSEIWATPVYSTGGGTGQTPDFGDADPFELAGGQSITGVDFTAVAGGSARATIALHSAGSSASLPASRCLEMTVYRLTGGLWSEYAPGWDYSCGDAALLAGGLPSGQYKFAFSDVLSGSTAFQTTYNGDATTLAAAPVVSMVAGQLKDLGTITVRVPEPADSTLEALDLDFLASDPDFDLSAYEDQVSTDGDPTAGEETAVQVGEEFAGQWVNVSLNSTPIVVGSTWHQVAADGTVTVTLPSEVDGAHRLAVGDASGQLIGWTAVEISEDTSTGGTDGSTGGTGGSTGGTSVGTSAAPKPTSGKTAGAVSETPAPSVAPTVQPTPTPVAMDEPEAGPAEEQEPTASEAPADDSGWTFWVAIGGLVLLVSAVVVLILRKRLV